MQIPPPPRSCPSRERLAGQVMPAQIYPTGEALPNVWGSLREVQAEARVRSTRPFHDYRKSVKHRLKVEMGLSRNITKRFMGHTSNSMDSYYTHLSAADLYPAVAVSWRDRGQNRGQT